MGKAVSKVFTAKGEFWHAGTFYRDGDVIHGGIQLEQLLNLCPDRVEGAKPAATRTRDESKERQN